jgi:hypothetical protein
MIARVSVWLCRFLSVSLFFSSSLVWSQATASILGTVSDPTGAAIQGVTITLENMGTAAVRTTVTDNAGSYQFPQVPPGTYRVRTEIEGFKSISRDNLQLLVNTPLTLPLRLQPGLIIEVVEVAEPLPAINTVDATIGNTIENSQIMALPLEARNAAGLLSLQPGVVYTGIEDKTAPDTRGGSVTGARSDQTNVTLDGVDVNDQQTGEAFRSVLPVTLDSIQEFRVVTSNPTANLGRSSGGQVSIITRGGTNLFHGSVYEYHRNTATSANDFFNNSTINPVTGKTLEKPKLIRNVFGASFGGPIEKNRLFFFLNFEDTLTRQEVPQLRIVPSANLRQGILQYVDVSGGIQRITPQQLQQMDPLQIGLNPAVLALFQQYPAGNDLSQGGDRGLNFVGFRFNAPLRQDKPSFIGRIDYTSPNNTHNVFVRGALHDFKEDELPAQFAGQTPARILLTNSKGIAIGHAWTISPKLSSDFRWGFTRQGLDFTGASTDPGLRLMGVDNIRNFDNRNASRKLPTQNIVEDLTWISGRHSLQLGANLRNIHNNRFTEQRSYAFYHSNPDWMTTLGRDMLPAGIAASFRTQYVRAQMALLGTISQVDVTYFVDRDGSVFRQPHIPRREFINNEYEWYLQDQWNLMPHLTLTAGLRYSYFEPPYEKNGFQVRANFDVHEWFERRRHGGALGIPSNANPLLSFVPAGKANQAPSFFDPDKNNFAPHFAVAWSPSYSRGPLHLLFGGTGQSSIRFGASVLYDRTGGTFPITADLSGAVGLATFMSTPTGAFGYASAPRFSGLQNLASIPLPPPPNAGFPATLGFTRNTGFMVDTKLRTPYATTFNFSISRDLPGNSTAEVAYVGRVGKKLLAQSDFAAPLVNFNDPKSGQSWIEASGIVADLIDRGAPLSQIPRIPFLENIFAPMATGNMSASQAFYNFMLDYAPSWMDGLHDLDLPNELGIPVSTIHGRHAFFQQQFDWLPTWTNTGQSSYHSFQLNFRKRLRAGLQADVNYTLAKALDNGSSAESEGQGAGQILNAFDPRQSIGFSDFDIRHQINANFVLDLPVGGQRALGANLPLLLNRILGSWRLSGLMRWHTGFPFHPLNGFYPTNFFVSGPASLKPGTDLPQINVTKNATGGPNIFSDAEAAYATFQHTASGFSGNRNILHGPGFFTLDTGLQKTIEVREQQQIQFRWETFNLTNTVNFDGRANSSRNRGIDANLLAKSSFGSLRSLAGTPRVMQFAVRYQF